LDIWASGFGCCTLKTPGCCFPIYQMKLTLVIAASLYQQCIKDNTAGRHCPPTMHWFYIWASNINLDKNNMSREHKPHKHDLTTSYIHSLPCSHHINAPLAAHQNYYYLLAVLVFYGKWLLCTENDSQVQSNTRPAHRTGLQHQSDWSYQCGISTSLNPNPRVSHIVHAKQVEIQWNFCQCSDTAGSVSERHPTCTNYKSCNPKLSMETYMGSPHKPCKLGKH